MSFQTTRDRESICFGDASLVYVRDRHGELRSPPGYEKSRVISQLRVCDTVYGPSCVRRLSSSLQSPRGLFEICKNFVAKNLHLLESLQDFPEAIGHELFLEALQVKTFHESSDNLKIFCEAYKERILEDLCLKEATLLIDEYMVYFQCFDNLSKLDLSHCKLGNKHEYLRLIGKMKSLECLYLKDNCLTDSGLATWSLPHRMLNTGPQFLKTLDLSCNPDLTGFCLKSLLKFQHLKSLNLSGTGVTLTPGIERFKKMMNFALVSYIEEFSINVLTSGWAAPFISELSSKLKERHKKPHLLTTFPTRNFYQSSNALIRTTQGEVITNNYPVILLQSLQDVFPGTLRTLRQSDEHGVKKRLATSDGHSTLKNNKISSKRAKVENLDELCDTKILDSYLQYL